VVLAPHDLAFRDGDMKKKGKGGHKKTKKTVKGILFTCKIWARTHIIIEKKGNIITFY